MQCAKEKFNMLYTGNQQHLGNGTLACFSKLNDQLDISDLQ